MIERYTITSTAEEIASRFSVDVPSYHQPNFNAAPSSLLPVITAEHAQGVSLFYWGIPPDQSRNKGVSERIINQRLEDVIVKPVFQKAVQSRRCLVPADGFYAWKKIGKKLTTPYRFVRKDRALFSFAGIWEEYEDVNGSAFHTFSVITIKANPVVELVYERMPVILTQAYEKIWLSKDPIEENLIDLFKPGAVEELESYTVSPQVNSLKNNNRTLILPAPPSDQYGNLTLFG